MSTLIRFEGTDERGPSAELWGGLVDWVDGTLKIDSGVCLVRDIHDSGVITLSGDTGSAATVVAEPGGITEFTATQAADAVSGFTVNYAIEAAMTKQAVIEVRLEAVADTAATEMF